MKDKEKLVKQMFEISEHIRYVAIYDNDSLSLNQRGDLKDASSNESDKYEELLVNPVLIKLASQRGNIDCGGFQYFIIRYGNFFVLLIPTKNGHVNIGLEPDQNPLLFVDTINALLTKYN